MVLVVVVVVILRRDRGLHGEWKFKTNYTENEVPRKKLKDV